MISFVNRNCSLNHCCDIMIFFVIGTSAEALSFLSKEGESILRMRGLPFTATATDVVSEGIWGI